MEHDAISASGRRFNAKLLKEDLDWALKLHWTQSIWKPKDALVDKNGESVWLYVGQHFDEEKIELVKNGWNHDHCDICASAVVEGATCATSGGQIICEDCYNGFIRDSEPIN